MSVMMRPWGHMHYRDRGPAGAPVVVFANSLGTDLRMWEAVADRLPGLRCIGFDKRGHGLSAVPDAPWTVEDLAGDALALMDHLGVGRAVMAGCSIGGMIAMAAGIAAPSRLRGLLVSNSAAKVGTAESWAARVAAVEDQGLRGMAEPILERWFGNVFRASNDVLPWRRMLELGDVAGYLGTCNALAKADFLGGVGAIRMPVLFLAGSEDQSTPVALVQETAAMISGARLEVLEGSGHIPALDNPDLVARLLADFVRGLP
jgi:3-oxoadipate enol-lactonase